MSSYIECSCPVNDLTACEWNCIRTQIQDDDHVLLLSECVLFQFVFVFLVILIFYFISALFLLQNKILNSFSFQF